MKIDAGLLDYIKRNEQAINANPIRSWPKYSDDPIACWRYFARCFGHGLAAFPEDQVISELQSLYGRWFIRAELSHKIPEISNKMFTGWILEARKEAKGGTHV